MDAAPIIRSLVAAKSQKMLTRPKAAELDGLIAAFSFHSIDIILAHVGFKARIVDADGDVVCYIPTRMIMPPSAISGFNTYFCEPHVPPLPPAPTSAIAMIRGQYVLFSSNENPKKVDSFSCIVPSNEPYTRLALSVR